MVRTRAAADPNAPPRVDICYVTPCKRRLRTFPEIQRYLDQNRIKDLTIEYFTFSKKVNVGIVIDERNMTESPPDDFPIRKRRGRPPKHARLLQFMESKAQLEQSNAGEEGGVGAAARISLEPHEIKSHSQSLGTGNESNVVVDRSSQQVLLDHSQDEATPTLVEGVVSSPFLLPNPGSSTATVVISQADPAPENETSVTYPHHASTLPYTSSSSNSTTVINTGSALPVKKKGGRKRKSTTQEGVPHPHVVVKKPRGRPKGSTNKPKAVTVGESHTHSLCCFSVFH